MNQTALRNLLNELAAGATDVDAAIERLRMLPFEDLDFARVDHHRGLRCGFPEVIFGLGKTSRQIEEIFDALVRGGHDVLATRV